jgi:hypothetical protein
MASAQDLNTRADDRGLKEGKNKQAKQPMPKTSPNFIFINTDQHRADCFSFTRRREGLVTPHLDNLALLVDDALREAAQHDVRDSQGWSCEFFIPFALFRGLGFTPPANATVWRGNVCRLDYDTDPRSHWTWSPRVGDEFHNYSDLGRMRFS